MFKIKVNNFLVTMFSIVLSARAIVSKGQLFSYSGVSHIRNHFMSVRSEPVSYGMRVISREYSGFFFEELSIVSGLD